MRLSFFCFFLLLAQVIAAVDAIDHALLRYTGSHSQSESARWEDLKGWKKNKVKGGKM